MELTKVELDREKLLALSPQEYTFFLSFGHHANEINAVTKLMYWAADGDEVDSPQEHGRQTMLTFLLRILAGKLFEGWRLLETTFLKRELAKTYFPLLDERVSRHLKHLKVYFGSKNATEVIRNQFGFHYSANKLAENLPDTDDPLLLYMDGEAAPNTLFFFSEVVLLEALSKALEEEGLERSLVNLVSEFFEIAVSFSQVADGIMDAMIEQSGKELRKGTPALIKLSDLPKFDEISIPWFTHAATVLERAERSA